MASTAISAQGSTLEIGTGTGAAVNITDVAPGFPTIVTSVAHGQTNGTVVAIASITGTMATTVNGSSYVISNVTADTFAIEVNTTGLAYTSGGTATPVTYSEIGNMKTYSGFDGEASEIDVTNLASTAKEFRLGLQDFGSFSCEWDVDFDDAGQNAARAAQVSAAVKDFRLTLPNSDTASFQGLVKNANSLSGGVDQVVTGSASIRITGSVTFA